MEPDVLEILDVMAARRAQTKLYRLYARTWEERGDAAVEEWGPYPWQVEFHFLGASYRERMLCAANRVGKSRSCAAEIACHLTGWYPSWWCGHRFLKANDWLVSGVTNEELRNVQQLSLLGKVDEFRECDGTGWVPKECIGPVSFRQCGVANVVDQVKVRHVGGQWSTITFKSYEQGATKYQGFEVDGWWADEEPELGNQDIFGEGRTRLLSRNGIFIFSRTPLFGLTPMVDYFMKGGPGRAYVTASMTDAPHLSARAVEEYLAGCAEHERDTRVKGIPMLGEGAVFNVSDDSFVIDPVPIPSHFRVICGIDFGIDHPAAACWLAHDADDDVIYVYDCYRKANETPVYHVGAVKARGENIPVAWPHDGINRDKGSGRQLIELYNDHGLNSLGLSARWDDESGGGQSTERGVVEILERMRTGRWKVFRTCSAWLEEKRMFHRKDGKIVKVNDDVIMAGLYALMMLRYAAYKSQGYSMRQESAEDATDPLGVFL